MTLGIKFSDFEKERKDDKMVLNLEIVICSCRNKFVNFYFYGGMNSGCVISLNTPRMHQLSNHILSRVHKRVLLRHRRLEHRLCVTARGPPIPVFVFSCLTGMCLLTSKHREVRLR